MVCNRCVSVVSNEVEAAGFSVASVSMGEIVLPDPADPIAVLRLTKALNSHGFEIMDDKKSALIEKIKSSIIYQIHNSKDPLKVNYSTFIANKVGREYSYLSHLFSEVEGLTIEHFIILQKIEKVKELLVYDEMSLSEIADVMDYSSVGHLSAQFKKVTGLTPSHFKSIKENKRLSLDQVSTQKPYKRQAK